MKTTPSTAARTLVAPVTWGTTYVTITELLPAGRPLLVSTLRVLPAGALLALVAGRTQRWRPRGREWSRTVVLALLNFGLFFPLLAVAVYRLPGGVAAAVGGVQPLLVLVLTWASSGRRPRPVELAVGVVAVIGVSLVVLRPGAHVDAVGVLAAVLANVSFAGGVVLTKRWPSPASRLGATGWQLLLSGALLVPLAWIVEGAPPALGWRGLAGTVHLSLVGTALAFVLWFAGIQRLPAAAPPLLGLASPVTGAALGWLLLGQELSPLQLLGFAVTLSAIAWGATAAAVERGSRPRSRTRHAYAIACGPPGPAPEVARTA